MRRICDPLEFKQDVKSHLAGWYLLSCYLNCPSRTQLNGFLVIKFYLLTRNLRVEKYSASEWN